MEGVARGLGHCFPKALPFCQQTPLLVLSHPLEPPGRAGKAGTVGVGRAQNCKAWVFWSQRRPPAKLVSGGVGRRALRLRRFSGGKRKEVATTQFWGKTAVRSLDPCGQSRDGAGFGVQRARMTYSPPGCRLPTPIPVEWVCGFSQSQSTTGSQSCTGMLGGEHAPVTQLRDVLSGP